MKQRLKHNTKGRKYYKSDSTYLNAVYKNNKTWIDSRLAGIGTETPLKIFKEHVKDYMEAHDISVTKAVSKVLRSRTYTSWAEISKENIISGLKSSGKYNEFRELTKVNGRYAKFDPNKLKYVGEGVYTYGNVYIYTFDKYQTGDDRIKLERY